jgi:hypothetical protein
MSASNVIALDLVACGSRHGRRKNWIVVAIDPLLSAADSGNLFTV